MPRSLLPYSLHMRDSPHMSSRQLVMERKYYKMISVPHSLVYGWKGMGSLKKGIETGVIIIFNRCYSTRDCTAQSGKSRLNVIFFPRFHHLYVVWFSLGAIAVFIKLCSLFICHHCLPPGAESTFFFLHYFSII